MRRFFLITLAFLLVFTGGFLAVSPLSAQGGGAVLFVSPGSGSFNVNKTFAMRIMVDSGGGVGINAAEGTLSYDPDYLTITSISDGSSIFKLWTTDPTYSNSSGKITFGGGAPGAYTGTAGEIFNVTFMTKQAGQTEVKWDAGVVLAADGRGTNVFGGFGNGTYTINSAPAEPEPEDSPAQPAQEEDRPKGVLPPLPEISSASHPDPETWYQENQPTFSWKILSDFTGVSYEIDENPEADPGAENDGIVETVTLQEQPDGERYFHIKYQNRFGWGKTAHRKVLIDATPPESFGISLDNGGDPTDPSPKLVFSTTDAASGLDHYLVELGLESKQISPESLLGGYYRPEPLLPGEYQARIAAVDKAGNAASSSMNFTVDPLKPPVITSVPRVHNRKDDLVIRGTSFYPNVTVKLYIGGENVETEEFDVNTDNEGNWSYFHKGEIKKGTYEVWGKIIDSRGAQSLESTRHVMTVISPSILDSYCGWIILLLLLAVTFLVLYILYLRQEFAKEKSRILKETGEAKNRLGKIFAALREEVDELIALADKRAGLSESERRVKDKLQESLDISEEFISKEVEDVEKEIKIKKKSDK